MLTSDLLRVRKLKGVVRAQYLTGESAARLLPIARQYVDLYKRMVGRPREELDEAVAAVEVSARDRVAALGLRKVLDDRCEFEAPSGAEPEEVRREVFLLAAEAQRSLDVRAAFDRGAVLARAGEKLGISADDIERVLFADLRGAEVLRAAWGLGAEGLLDRYNVALAQSILLRATEVTLVVSGEAPDRVRRLFRTMRFLGLLHRVHVPAPTGPSPDTMPPKAAANPPKKKKKKVPNAGENAGSETEATTARTYAITIDGPFSLFGPSQKYGMRLATLLHAVLACERFSLSAKLVWGARREDAEFHVTPEDGLAAVASELPSSSPSLEAFVAGFEKLGSEWQVKPAAKIFATPGEPAVIPDLVFSNRETGEEVFLEAFGFWSRAAVWARVEQIRRGGLPVPLMLAISKELRVSAEVLDEDDLGEVYVYKATMLPRAVLARLSSRSPQAKRGKRA
ncbi:MAG: DUF790 family protein [Polyangiaceae bacterium]